MREWLRVVFLQSIAVPPRRSRLPLTHRLPADSSPADLTALLSDLSDGVPGAAHRLAGAVMAEMHRIALRALQNEADGHTLQPTEIVEAVLVRLLGERKVSWENRAHCFSVASQVV